MADLPDQNHEEMDPTDASQLTGTNGQQIDNHISPDQGEAGNPVQQNPSMRNDQGIQRNRTNDWSTNDPTGTMKSDQPMSPSTIYHNEMPASPRVVNQEEQTWFRREDIDELHSRWNTIQVQFIDDPCSAVEQGEALVAETVERMKQMMSDQQQALDQRWLNHDNISTEELRIILQDYRTLMNRLLNA